MKATPHQSKPKVNNGTITKNAGRFIQEHIKFVHDAAPNRGINMIPSGFILYNNYMPQEHDPWVLR